MIKPSAEPETRPPAANCEQLTDAHQGAALQPHIAHLQVAVERELRGAPDGMSEYELIKKLQQPPWQLLGEVRFDQAELLYPVHFLLFHTMYTLRDQLAADGETLELSPLRLRLYRPSAEIPATGSSGLPGQADELRAFYLDLNQYRLSEQHIRTMLDNFYRGLHVPGHGPTNADLLTAARCLGYEQLPTDFAGVKQRFRRAVMHAHPDRGGTTEQIQRLNTAFGLLREHFGER